MELNTVSVKQTSAAININRRNMKGGIKETSAANLKEPSQKFTIGRNNTDGQTILLAKTVPYGYRSGLYL